MKNKLTNISLAFSIIIAVFFLNGCKKKINDDAFIPYLDTLTKCKIQIAGRYQNFEALEAEFDRFNEFYPNVELSYNYLDNYKVTISTALAGLDAPDIFMTFPWMLDKTNYNPLLDNAENLADTAKTGIELSAINKEAEIQKDNKGNIIYDNSTKDSELVKENQDVDEYMKREVYPHVPDAHYVFEENMSAKKPVIKTGAEIPFTRYFYKYQEPEKSEDLEKEFMKLEEEVNSEIKQLFEEA